MQEKTKNRIVLLAGFFAPMVLIPILNLITGIAPYYSPDTPMSTIAAVLASVIFVLFFAFVIFCRIKKYEKLLTGFFLFLCIIVLSFVICFGLRIAGENESSVFFAIYNFYTIMMRPFVNALTLLVGVSEFFRKGLLLAIVTLMTGSACNGIKKQKEFEKDRPSE